VFVATALMVSRTEGLDRLAMTDPRQTEVYRFGPSGGDDSSLKHCLVINANKSSIPGNQRCVCQIKNRSWKRQRHTC